MQSMCGNFVATPVCEMQLCVLLSFDKWKVSVTSQKDGIHLSAVQRLFWNTHALEQEHYNP